LRLLRATLGASRYASSVAQQEFFGTQLASREIGAFHLTLREYGEHTRLAQHAHEEAFATIVVEGGFREDSGARTLHCGLHDVIVHAPGERHVNHFAGRRTRCLSVLGAAFDRSELLASPAISAIAVKVLREFRHPDSLSPMVIESTMLELYVAAARCEQGAGVPRWLRQVRTAVERRFQEPFTLAELAGSVGVHPGHLARAFRRHYGATVGELVRDLRVAYARRRLATAAPLRDIACDAGFADQSHFTRTFRRATGLTPAQYRRTLRPF
jgi:AraC family transcriptional regulator